MKRANILQLLEMHVDKIVFGVVTLVSLTVLWIYVVGSPYGQKVDGKKRGPGEIDTYVKTKAELLRQDLEQSSDPIIYDKTYLADYNKLVQSPLSTIASLSIPCPGTGQTVPQEDRIYVLPEIGPLTEVAAFNLRGAAQKPLDADTDEMVVYTPETEQLEDVDLVTVSARFNMQALFNGFQQSFTGPRLKPSWQDASLAKPVFARLELQRREYQQDGSWSQWVSVPRTQIDSYRELLEQLPLTTDALEAVGVSIWINQYVDKLVQQDILQPQAYTFVISQSEWMPPTYLQEAVDFIKKQDDARQKELREERSRRLEEMNRMEDRRPEGGARPAAQPRQERRTTDNRRNRERPGIEMGGYEQPGPTKPVRKERTLDDVKADVKKQLFDERTDFASLRDAVLVWAHDDTAQPGKTYQYRLRLGVFNPIAGKDWVREDQAQYKNQVVLWSDYTEPTADVYIPKRIHVFPTELLAAKSDAGEVEGVKVEIAKYNIGRWCTQTFEVYPGQIIGQKAEPKPLETPDATTGLGPDNIVVAEAVNPQTANGEPLIVDFTTPFTLVDINHLVAWGSSAQRRSSYDVMLYHDPELQMREASIGKNNWNDALRKEYQEVQDELQRASQLMPSEMMPIMPRMPGVPGGPLRR